MNYWAGSPLPASCRQCVHLSQLYPACVSCYLLPPVMAADGTACFGCSCCRRCTTMLPVELSALTGLCQLNLEENELNGCFDTLEHVLAQLTQLEELDLGGCGLPGKTAMLAACVMFRALLLRLPVVVASPRFKWSHKLGVGNSLQLLSVVRAPKVNTIRKSLYARVAQKPFKRSLLLDPFTRCSLLRPQTCPRPSPHSPSSPRSAWTAPSKVLGTPLLLMGASCRR